MYLIVYYKQGQDYATEIITGKKIDVLNFEFEDKNVYKINTNLHTYISNGITNNKSITFNQDSNLASMPLDKLKKVLEFYNFKFNKNNLGEFLDNLLLQGEQKKQNAEKLLKEKQDKLSQEKKYVQNLFEQLLNKPF